MIASFFFEYHNEVRRTRNTQIKLLQEPSFKKGFQRPSVSHRCVKLFTSRFTSKCGILDENFEPFQPKEVLGFYHKLRETVLLDNLCLANSKFEWIFFPVYLGMDVQVMKCNQISFEIFTTTNRSKICRGSCFSGAAPSKNSWKCIFFLKTEGVRQLRNF